MLSLADKMTIDAASVRETVDGYLVADARTARTGIQTYLARELGWTDRAPGTTVRVYRPPAAVFDAAALGSMAHRPMTNDHPAEAVTAQNWRALSIGHAGGEVVRDGGFVRVPLVMMDAGAIRDFKDGKRELSWGYTCEVKMQDGIVPDGELDAGQAYDAVQTDIRANHIALCQDARGGPMLTFGDNHQPGGPTVATKNITVDGLSVEVTDAAELAINKLQRQVADGVVALAKLQDDVKAAQNAAGEQAALVATRDGQIVALNAQLADASDPVKLQAAASARAALVGAARPILGDGFAYATATDIVIRRAAVDAKLGDKAKGMNDGAIEGAFAVLTADAASHSSGDPLRDAVLDGGLTAKDGAKKADDARKAMIDNLQGKAAA